MTNLSTSCASALLATLLLAGTTHPAAPAPSAPADASQRTTRFEQQVEADRAALGLPGLSIAVLEDGEVLTARGFGYADVDRRIPATADTLYHLASVTKTFTAILVLRLVEQGKLDLDEPVSRYAPEVTDDRVHIRHLLSHTSEGTPGEAFKDNPDRFEYLGKVIEQEYGKPLRQVYVETFLEPLAMRDSVPSHDVADDDTTFAMLGKDNLARYRANLAHFAQPYTHWGAGEVVFAGYPPREFWVSAGLLSTVLDMARYDRAVDRHQLLRAETLASAWQPVRSSAGKALEFGTGWYVTDYRGERLVWHYGHWGTGFSALYLKVPARHLTLIALANSEALADHPYKLGGGDVTNNLFACDFINTFIPGVANGTYPGSRAGQPGVATTTGPALDCELNSRTALANWKADRLARFRKSVPVDRKVLATYAGGYKLPHRVVTVTEEGGHLYIDVPQGYRSEMHAESPTQFFLKIRPWTMTFVKQGGKVVRLDFLENGEVVSGTRVE
jgi:CubicO group peptidase (beta-lactamase class C family)